MRFSIPVTTTREVVVEAKSLAQALSRARTYSKDCFPSVGPPSFGPPREVSIDHSSRTSDDEWDTPRDA